MDSQLADKFAAAYVDREEFRAAATATHAESLSEFASIQGTDSAAVASARKMSDAAMDMSRKTQEWSETKTQAAQYGSQQSIPWNEVGTGLQRLGIQGMQNFAYSVMGMHGDPAFQDALHNFAPKMPNAVPTGAKWADGRDITTTQLAALTAVASGQAPTSHLNQGNLADSQQLLADAMTQTGVQNMAGISDFSAPEQGGLANDVEPGRARNNVLGAGNLGPSEGAEKQARSGMAMWNQQGRDAATGRLVAETGLGVKAQAAGRYAKEFLNPDGSLNQPVFEAASAGMKEKTREILSAANENQRTQMSDEFNAMYANTPLGQGWMRRLTNDDQGGARLGGVVAMAQGNHTDNTRVAGYEAAIRDGSMFGGHAIAGGVDSNGDVAKVLV